MDELLERSARFIDDGVYQDGWATNPIGLRLHEVADDIALVEGFSHVIAVRTGGGLCVVDTGTARFGERAVPVVRSWSTAPVDTIVYTHGHVDHVGGARAFLDAARADGQRVPSVVGHRNVVHRFDRYALTSGYNAHINMRQFGKQGRTGMAQSWPGEMVRPTLEFEDRHEVRIGEMRLELRHAKGETDDHAWGWWPERKAVFVGDFVTWVFPNAGNPAKVQRYPKEWAAALREMASLGPELLLPAHGLPIAGRERVARVLGDVAESLESLLWQTLALMNDGATLDTIVHEVRVPGHLAGLPYLQPVYDEPEFVVRNIWRLYGGWYDGNPSRLKPAADAVVAAEVANLAGGPARLASRAAELAASGSADDLRLACHLAELAALAAPGDRAVHGVRADVYRRRRDSERSLMARAIYRDAAEASDSVAAQ